MSEHVDLYRIEIKNRRHVFIANVVLGPDMVFHVCAGDDVLEKRLRQRIESSPVQPTALDDLGQIFDAPHLLATKPHDDERCPFAAGHHVPLTTRPSEVSFVYDETDLARA